MKIFNVVFALGTAGMLFSVSSCASTKAQDSKDKSIQFEKGAINEYGTRMAFTKEIKVKADTSTSIVVDWRNEEVVSVPNVSATEENVIYKKTVYTDGNKKGSPLELNMNIMYHKDGEAQPVVVFIPGGGFLNCDSKNSLRLERQYLAEHGFAVASIEYHVVGNGLVGDVVQDVRDAITFLNKNASRFNIDASRLAVTGNSAGGYMTALVTAMDSTGIKAAVDLYGLSDLIQVGADFDEENIAHHHSPFSSESQFVNGVFSGKAITDDLESAAKANPLTYINGDECPMLIMHGDADSLVSSNQSLLVHNALTKAGVSSTRYSLTGAEHGKGGFNTVPAQSIIIEFLNKYLKA